MTYRPRGRRRGRPTSSRRVAGRGSGRDLRGECGLGPMSSQGSVSSPQYYDTLYHHMRSTKQAQQPLVYNIELVDKLLHVLETLRDAREGLTLQQLAARTGYVTSSIHRALGSLKWHGYVEQPVARGAYRLGMKCLLLARGLQDTVELLPHARPYLREIADAFDESAYLAILRGGRGIFVEVVETRRRELRLVGPIGADVAYHATAAGKVFAANLPPSARAALLGRIELTARTPRTRTRRAEVEKEWKDVARRGFAVNREETILGANFVAAPIFDAERAICGAISVGVPSARYSAALGRHLATRLKEVCRRLSDTLAEVGYVHDDRQLHELR
ncbi:MAG: helix-turn-helix domain-containing protein [Luteitalea sp.]|nr:helix-turn-helix domain-containing protein [Luteitalea sp.]